MFAFRSEHEREGVKRTRALLTPPRAPFARDPPPPGEGENNPSSFSRCAFASEFWQATV